MSVAERIFTMNTLAGLIANPLVALHNFDLIIGQLPAGGDASVQPLWLAASPGTIALASNEAAASGFAGLNDGAVQRPVLISPMRSNGALPARLLATGRAQVQAAELWVTTAQTGCSVLLLDWGIAGYSMIHLQPSKDQQFNAFGRGLLGLGMPVRAAYKNLWLKQELSSIVLNTGGGMPLRYILIQTQFDALSHYVQILGVRQAGQFNFYRQKRPRGGAGARSAEQLRWMAWWSYLPYWGY